jgi:outer membrane protein assembly factor BamD (BamD/ComL family)
MAMGWVLVACASVDAAPPSRADTLRFDADKDGWVRVDPPTPGTESGDLAIARAAYADGEYRRARKLAKRWVKNYGEASALYPDVLLLQARLDKEHRDFHDAYLKLKRLVDEFGGAEVENDALVELFNVAEVFLSGVRKKFWGVRLLSVEDVGLEILDEISAGYPESTLAEQAIKTKADYFYAQGDFSLAELEYDRLRQSFSRSRYSRYALRRSADSAQADFSGIKFDDSALIEAAEKYELYARQYPGSAEQEGIGLILLGIHERQALKEFEIASYYDRTGHRAAAEFYYRSTIDRWPATIAAGRASAALGVGPPAEAPDNQVLEGDSSSGAGSTEQ